jgi:hypothetical protein
MLTVLSRTAATLFATFAFLGAVPAHSDEALDVERLFHAFSACDGSFFREIQAQRMAFSTVSDLKTKADVAWPRVEDRAQDATGVQIFRRPLQLGPVDLYAYVDTVTDLGELGMYYNWGFVSSQSPEAVAGAIVRRAQGGERLREVAGTYARLDVWVYDKWIAVGDPASMAGQPAGSGLERVLLIEATDTPRPGSTLIACSLQGKLSRPLLRTFRPDIE